MFSKAKIVFFILLLAVSVFSQNKEEEEKEKERQRRNMALLEQVVRDARGLKLPENRAFVAAKAAAVICKADEKLARKLFDGAAADLIAGQAEAEAQTRNKRYFTNLIYGQEPRWSILFLVAGCDASLALDLMGRTRPPLLERAIAGLTSLDETVRRKDMGQYGGPGQYANNELQNEQRLISMAADQDPARAVKLVRESLKKGVTYQTLELLRKIHTKDAAAANALTEEAMRKLQGEDLVQNAQHADTIGYFLQEVTRTTAGQEDEGLKVSENLIRDLVEKMVRFWLDPDVTGYYASNAMTTVEKYSPGQAARVKQKFEPRNNETQTPQQQDYQRMISGEVPVEEMITRAPKLPQPYMRNEVFRRAAQKLAEGGSLAQAEKLLGDNLPEAEADNYISQIQSNSAYTAIGAGKFNEANDIINRIPNLDQRISLLVQLANSIYQKDQKANDKWAASILGQARELVPDDPESYEEISAYFNIASASAQIEPETAFVMAAAIIPMLNELAQANATMAKLRNNGNFRNGEFQIMSGQYATGVYGLENLLSQLKEKDFERTVLISNGISRLDARLACQLQLIDFSRGGIVILPIGGRRFGEYIEGE